MIAETKSFISRFWGYIITYLLFAFSATAYFSSDRIKGIVFITALSSLYFLVYRQKLDRKFVFVFMYVLAIFFLQMLFWQATNIGSLLISFSITTLSAYLAYKLIGGNIFKYYVNIVLFLGFLSLVFWTLQNISPPFDTFIDKLPYLINDELLTNNYEQFIIFTHEMAKVELLGIELYRNSGPTWEPGAWAGFLIVALMVNYKSQPVIFAPKNIILILVILSTFSTAGYISLFIFIIFTLTRAKLGLLPKLAILLIILPISINIYVSAEFLNEKISSQLTGAVTKNIYERNTGRLFSLLKGWNSITEYHFVGKGIVASIRDDDEAIIKTAVPYGILGLAVTHGVIALPLFLLYFFRSWIHFFNLTGNWFSILMLIFTLILLLMSQGFHTTPVFILFFFKGLLTERKNMANKDKNNSFVFV